MPSLESSFAELKQRLRDRTRLGNTGGDPIFYLVFPPRQMLTVKRQVKAWIAQLNLEDWDAEVLSLGEVIAEFSPPTRCASSG